MKPKTKFVRIDSRTVIEIPIDKDNESNNNNIRIIHDFEFVSN